MAGSYRSPYAIEIDLIDKAKSYLSILEGNLQQKSFKVETRDPIDLRKRLGDLFLNEHLSDITFIVGPQQQRVTAHRIVFWFNDCGVKDDLPKVIGDVDRDTFFVFLNYLYTNKIELTEENVVDLLKLCDLFQLDLLKKKCMEFKENSTK